MKLEDPKISQAIVETYHKKLMDIIYSDCIIVGAGPSGLVAAKLLADAGYKVVVLERNLFCGGGMWGGGMMFNQVVIQDSALKLLDMEGVRYEHFADSMYTADSVECICALAVNAVQAGAHIMNNISFEDTIIKNDKMEGLVINWTCVSRDHMMVDPIMIESKAVLDATGHEAMVCNKLVAKMGNVLKTPSGAMEGEKPMNADQGEQQVVENTQEAYPGLFVCGMAANAAFGGQRMGPVFGGMLLSGEKVAKQIMEKIGK